MNSYLRDILDQPHSLRKAVEIFLRPDNLHRMKQIPLRSFERIIFCGMGVSHYAGYSASIYLNANGFYSTVKSASQLLHYETGSINEKTLLFLVSQSGESIEIVNIVKKLPQNCTVVAITNNPESTLGRRGNYVFGLNVSPEESVATRTYVATIILLDLIIKSMIRRLSESQIGDKDFQSIHAAISGIENFLTVGFQSFAEKLPSFLGTPPYISLTGRGYSYSSIFAGGLLIKEVAKLPCISLDSGEFRHGPFELVDEHYTGIILAPEGLTYEISCKLAYDIAEKGGKVVLITNKKPTFTLERIFPILLAPVEEFYSSIIDIVPLQLIANFLAENKNLEPGKYRWSSKITRSE